MRRPGSKCQPRRMPRQSRRPQLRPSHRSSARRLGSGTTVPPLPAGAPRARHSSGACRCGAPGRNGRVMDRGAEEGSDLRQGPPKWLLPETVGGPTRCVRADKRANGRRGERCSADRRCPRRSGTPVPLHHSYFHVQVSTTHVINYYGMYCQFASFHSFSFLFLFRALRFGCAPFAALLLLCSLSLVLPAPRACHI